MKTIKNLTLLMGLFAVVLLAVGCDKAGDKEKSIIGKWKLVGIVDIETGTITELKPKDDRCYYLSFNEDNTFSGISSTNDLTGEYRANLDSTIRMTFEETYRAEMGNGRLYLEFLRFVQTFSLPSNKELRLYGTDREGNDWGKYLLFKRQETDLPPPPSIDWDNYNDVFTIHRNYSDNRNNSDPSFFWGDTEKTIKVAGYIVHPGTNLHEIDPDFFYFADCPNENYFSDVISIQAATPEVAEQLKIKFENRDLTGKCYITGSLFLDFISVGDGCTIFPVVRINNVDDIIFE